MRSLNNNTLEDIAKYNDKTFKLFNYLSQTDQPLMISELAKISQSPDKIELLEAFRKDVTSTASMLEKAHALLSTVDSRDRVTQLKGASKDLKQAFGDNYDPQKQTIDMGDIKLPLKQNLSKEQFRNLVVQSILGINNEDFEAFFKKRKSIYSLDEASLTNDEERIEFLSIVKDQRDYEPIINKIENLHNSFISLRATFSEEEKQKIDREITFSRSMIDSVTKQSTYLTQDEGIMQIGNDHKGQDNLLNQLHDRIKQSPYIKAVELDKDASLNNVINVLDQLSQINLGLGNEIVFKVRKLGNYNANGLYMDSQNIVAVDISHPSSMIHEFTHAIDFSNGTLSSTVDGQNLIKRFKYKIDRNELPKNRQNYYLRDTETMARLGEIAYLFDEYTIQDKESINDFIQRVQQTQSSEEDNKISMIKNIDYYLDSNNKAIYFNLESWSRDDIDMCQEFYSALFNAENKPLKEINPIPVFQEPATVVRKSPRSRYEKRPVALMNKHNMEFLLDYNKQHKIIEFDKLFEHIMHNPVHLSRTTKSYNRTKYKEQRQTMDIMAEWLDKEENPYLNFQVYKNYLDLMASEKFEKEMRYFQAIKDNQQDQFKGEQWLSEEENEVAKIEQKIEKERSKPETDYRTLTELRQEARQYKNQSFKQADDLINELYPDFQEVKQAKRNAFVVNEESKTLNTQSKRLMFEKCIDTVAKYMRNYGIDQVLAFEDRMNHNNDPYNNGNENNNDNNKNNPISTIDKTFHMKNVRRGALKTVLSRHGVVFDDEKQDDNLKSLAQYFDLFRNCQNDQLFESNLETVQMNERYANYGFLSPEIKQYNVLDLYNSVLPGYQYQKQHAPPMYNVGQSKENKSIPSTSEAIRLISQAPDKSNEYDNLKKHYNLDNQNNEMDELLNLAQNLQSKKKKNKPR